MELKDLTSKQLIKLRKQVYLNSLFICSYENSFGIDPNSVCDFFDSYIEDMQDLWEYEKTENKNNYEDDYFENENNFWKYFVNNNDNLIDYFNSIEW